MEYRDGDKYCGLSSQSCSEPGEVCTKGSSATCVMTPSPCAAPGSQVNRHKIDNFDTNFKCERSDKCGSPLERNGLVFSCHEANSNKKSEISHRSDFGSKSGDDFAMNLVNDTIPFFGNGKANAGSQRSLNFDFMERLSANTTNATEATNTTKPTNTTKTAATTNSASKYYPMTVMTVIMTLFYLLIGQQCSQ